MKDELGDRFKAVEHEWRAILPKNKFYVLRVDGRAFHTWTRGLEKPFDPNLNMAMDATAMALARDIPGTLCAYVQSDEISVVFTDLASESTEAWFGGVVQKLTSVAASMATAWFNSAWSTVDADPSRIPALFDARVVPLDTVGDVADYLWWRQKDCRRNAVSMLAHHYIGKNAVHKIGTADRITLLAEHGITADDQDGRFVNGGLVVSGKVKDTTTYTNKRTGEDFTTEFERTVWTITVNDRIRNWFYDTHVDRYAVASA